MKNTKRRAGFTAAGIAGLISYAIGLLIAFTADMNLAKVGWAWTCLAMFALNLPGIVIVAYLSINQNREL
jgi:ABC-type Fe3+ transport system permease subunit